MPVLSAALLTITLAASTVVHNVNGYTLSADGERLERFTYLQFDSNGRVLATGSDDPPRPERHLIDGGGATMLPGLIDAHGHVSSLGAAMMQVNLVGTTSLAEAQQRVQEFAAANPQATVVLGRGWNQEHWLPAEFPTAADLDRAVADRPVVLVRIDGHALWANSAALAAAGIGDDTESPPGGQILRDDRGHATGVLVDSAMSLMAAVTPAVDASSREANIGRAMGHLLSVGLTSVHDAGIGLEDVRAYQRLHRRGIYGVRIYAMLAGIDVMRAFGPPQTSDNQRLSIRSIKLVSDGALGSRGAALLAPYQDDRDHLGLTIIGEKALAARIIEAREAGYQVNVHAIGDRANRELLNAHERAGSRPGERHRNEHAQIIHTDDIARFARLGIVPSMQPIHATSDMHMAGKRLGAHRLAGAYAWRSLLDAGLRIAGGSDFPVEPANPFLGWYAAITRQTLDGEPSEGWLPGQRMTRTEAFRAFTLDAAWAAFQENEIGTLTPGKWVDFILVDTDPFEADPTELAATRVQQTWIAGQRTWAAP